MSEVKDTVFVTIEYHDGHEDDGTPYFVASCDDLMFTTEAETFEQLLENIGECLDITLKVDDPITAFGVVPNARVKLVMEFPADYAKTA